jgi:nucleoside-diphosphate-sugar epimerase
VPLTVAVTGATGYVGGFVVDELLRHGCAVRALVRTGVSRTGVAPLRAGIDWLEGDLEDAGAVGALVAGADALVHLALAHVPGRYRGGEGDDLDGFVRTNVGATLALLAAARRAAVGRVVCASSRAVYGASLGAPRVDEGTLPLPDTFYGAAKSAVEAFVSAYGRGADGAPWAICALRPTGVYGVVTPASRSKWYALVRAALRGDAGIADRAGGEVHGTDVARATWVLLTAGAAGVAGRVFNLGDITVSHRDVVAAVGRLSGRRVVLPSPRAAMPAGIMDCAGLAALGLRCGGWPLFERTLAELVALAQRDEAAGN